MANVRVRNKLELDNPTLIEGLPGVGLVGKIATDHIVDQFDMTYVASVAVDGLPEVAVYREDETDVYPPVRIYGNAEHNVLALQSDVPVSRTAADEFADAVTGWLDDYGATPLYLSGLPHQSEDPSHVPEVFGVSTGSADDILGRADVDLPPEEGVIGGPTGALVHQASLTNLDSVGLVVQADPQFPDPAASKQLIDKGIEPIADITVDTEELVESAEEIQEQKQKLAQRMQQAAEEESSQAQPLRMFE